MFAFAVWDREHRELTLCRDRLGKKPLYYTKVGTTFVFGSELKALCAYPGFRGTVDRDALALYLQFSYVPAPHSIYAGVCKLPPGHVAVVRQGESPKSDATWDARDNVRGALEIASRSRMRKQSIVSDESAADCNGVSNDRRRSTRRLLIRWGRLFRRL
jgi:asparagine synthase (glutamine-hydrolysing)